MHVLGVAKLVTSFANKGWVYVLFSCTKISNFARPSAPLKILDQLVSSNVIWKHVIWKPSGLQLLRFMCPLNLSWSNG